MVDLACVLEKGDVRLEPLGERHVEPLRAACARDNEIWEIYPVNLTGAGFDAAMARFHRTNDWVRFAVLIRDEVAGMTNYIHPDMDNAVVEIGGTYIEPAVRGTGVNGTMKQLMIDHAFARGFRRIEFRVDARNARSQAAIRKLGARHEGTLRRNRVTWTGFVRDTCVFGLFEKEWKNR